MEIGRRRFLEVVSVGVPAMVVSEKLAGRGRRMFVYETVVRGQALQGLAAKLTGLADQLMDPNVEAQIINSLDVTALQAEINEQLAGVLRLYPRRR